MSQPPLPKPQLPLQPGHRVDRRYSILQQIGHGGFGRTYLATDSRRHHERCVLKEFAPLMTANPADVEKARELFRREAAVLHRLRHPQIPEFREEFEVCEAGQTRWMLVQEWIAGETYLELLRSGPLLEVQVIQFLLDFLPILDYLHNHQPPVIHRDISLDNILLNAVTNRPTLIDFGTVKQAMHHVSGLPQERPTLIAKRGYSPPEQTMGEAYPSSDLYALGVCSVALLTGQRNPVVLYDAHDDRWHWRAHVAVSSGLAGVLDHLLQSQPRLRYGSADEVINALMRLSSPSGATAPQATSRPAPQRLSQAVPQALSQTAPQTSPQTPPPISVAYRTIPPHEGVESRPVGQRPFNAEQSPRTQQLTIAVGRSVPQEPVATNFIWPLWVRPLLFVQPLLSLLAFRVGPALLLLLLAYGGAQRMITTAQVEPGLPKPSATENTTKSSPDTAQPSATQPPGAPQAETRPSETRPPETRPPETQQPAPPFANIDWSEVELPTVSLPGIKLPEKIVLPTLVWPEVNLPSIDWRNIKLPKMDDLPEVNLPKLNWHQINLPQVNLPQVNLPKIDISAKPEVGQGCRDAAIARFNQLPPEKASWQEVDQQFASQYPDYPTPLEPTNPEHKVFIESWCGVANGWLDQVQP